MPDSASVADRLTQEQLRFISKFLHVIPGNKKHQAAEQAHNSQTMAEFDDYRKALADVKAKLDTMRTDHLQMQYRLNVQTDTDEGEKGKALNNFLGALNEIERMVGAVRSKGDEGEAASDGKKSNSQRPTPVFKTCAEELGKISKACDALAAKLPVVEWEETDAQKLFEKLFDAAISMRTFRDTSRVDNTIIRNLTPVVADMEDDADGKKKAAELKRQKKALEDALDANEALVDEAVKDITVLSIEAKGRSSKTVARKLDAAESVLDKLRKDREEHLDVLEGLINGAAEKEFEDRAARDPDDKIAKREVERVKTLKENKKRLVEAEAAIAKDLDDQRKHLDSGLSDPADPGSEALGFNQRKEIEDRIATLEARQETISIRVEQLELYAAQANGRLKQLAELGRVEQEAQDLIIEDPTAALQASKSEFPDIDPAHQEEFIQMMNEGAPNTKGDRTSKGRFDEQRDKYRTAANRVSADARVFPNEEPITDITEEQCKLLIQIVDKAAELIAENAVEKKLKESMFLLQEAEKTYHRFLGLNRFPLPVINEAVSTPRDKVRHEIAELRIQLDRFWGRGGDADDLRKEIDKLEAKIFPDKGAPLLEVEALKSLGKIREKLIAAERALQPSTSDDAARQKAADQRNAINATLAQLMRTHKVDPAFLHEIPANRLLEVSLPDGAIDYFEIEDERGGTKIRRVDKEIPFEVIQRLFDQAGMLDLLGQSDIEGGGPEIEEAVEQAAKLLADAENGGPDYVYVGKRIKDCKQILADSKLAEWRPQNLESEKARFETFQANYLKIHTGAEARAVIDPIYTDLKQLLTDVAGLKDRHKAVKDRLKEVEKKLGDQKKGQESIGTRLNEVIKGGKMALLQDADTASMTAPEISELDSLLSDFEEDIGKLQNAAATDVGVSGALQLKARAIAAKNDARSAKSIGEAESELTQLEDEVNTTIDKIKKPNGRLGLDYLRDLSTFVADTRIATERRAEAEEAADNLRHRIENKLETIKFDLDVWKTLLPNYKVHKGLYDSNKTQLKTAQSSYKSSKNVDDLTREYTRINNALRQLSRDVKKELTSSDVPNKDRSNISLEKWGDQLKAAATELAGAVGKVADQVVSAAKADDTDKQNVSLQTVVNKATDNMKMFDATTASKIVEFSSGARSRYVAAVQDENNRKDVDSNKLPAAREAVLAEIRRMRAELDAAPALKLYRNNPFDQGQAWAQFTAKLHTVEVNIITAMKP